MIAEEILQKYKNNTHHYADQDYDEDNIIKAMQEYARIMCKKQKEICFEKGITGIEGAFGICWNRKGLYLNKSSIINSPLPKELQ